MRKNDIELMTFVESYRRSARDRDINLETNLSDLAYDTSDSDSEYECLFSEEIHKRRESWKVRQRNIPSLPTYILPYNEQLKLTRAMNSSRPSFVSHVDGMDDTDGAEDLSNLATARLLPGEKEVQSADNVCLYSSKTGGLTSGQTGRLFVTTLKVSFQLYVPGGGGLSNKLLSDTDIPLSSIESVYELHGENSDKKRKLALGSVLPTNKISGIVIRCKNFKFFKFKFNLQSMKVDGGRNITNAILHYARPSTLDLLFGYENSLSDGASARASWTWEQAISDAGVSNVRVTRANEAWLVTTSLPRQFVIPGHVTDNMLSSISVTCSGNRPPVWVWGHRAGGSLYIQPEFGIVPSAKLDNLLLEYFKSDNLKVIDSREHLPKLSTLEESYTAMLDIHCVDTEKEMRERDERYFSSLESAGWLSTLGACLRLAEQAADDLVMGKTVVIKDEDGRTLSILLSSLVMVMSGECRTREGLERLILRNWINLGFQFSKHHTLTAPAGSDSKSSKSSLCPLFLLFLDCVHQLCHQFPAHFQFLPAYLIAVWDAALLPVTQTFMFDCDHDREQARRQNKSTNTTHTPSFDWSLQFTQEQIDAWDNPLFEIPLRPPRLSRGVSTDISPFSMVTDRPPRAPVFQKTAKFCLCLVMWLIWKFGLRCSAGTWPVCREISPGRPR